MQGHTIVCGTDALALRIREELQNAGTDVVAVDGPRELVAAGIHTARAVVCAGEDDAVNLEMALLARELNPDVRVVTRLANGVLREAVALGNGPGATLDVADLAAPTVVEDCLHRTTHTIAVAGMDFVVSGAPAPRDATLRELYGDLAPVAVIRAEGRPGGGEVIACPGRDFAVSAGDWTSVLGTTAELAAHGVVVGDPLTGSRVRRTPVRRLLDAARVFRDDVNPMFYRALSVSLALLVGSTLLLRFAYRRPGMSWIDALYFSTETIATVGYGDFSFADQPTWLRLWGIALMFAGVTTTAILVAFVADVLLSRRLAYSAGRRRVRHLRHHVVVVGLGSFGSRVIGDLAEAGHDVAVVERNDQNRHLSAAADHDVPVIFGDATLRETLASARIERARAVALLTENDMVNIETAIVVREMLGARARSVPIVLRVYDRTLGAAVAHRFGFDHVRSTVELAAPWFIGAAMGLQVFGTFSVGQQSFMLGGVHVEPGSELDGMRMADLSTRTRVIAITRPQQPVRLHPRRDARLTAGDTGYLVGPYRELLATLRKGQATVSPATSG